MSTKIQIRRGTSAQWAAANPILADGEFGLDTTTGGYKLGNGVSTWTVLSAWVAPTLLNSWVNTGSGLVVAGYRKIGDVVSLKGTVSTGTLGSIIFNLPAGFRPVEQWEFASEGNIATFGVFVVKANGDVQHVIGGNARFSINCNFSTV